MFPLDGTAARSHDQRASGYDYFMQIFFSLRDCVVNNPSTPDGTFFSPRYASKVYHCVDSTGSCYFKGY